MWCCMPTLGDVGQWLCSGKVERHSKLCTADVDLGSIETGMTP